MVLLTYEKSIFFIASGLPKPSRSYNRFRYTILDMSQFRIRTTWQDMFGDLL